MYLLEKYLSFPVTNRGRRAVNLQFSWNRNPPLSANNSAIAACARSLVWGCGEGQHTAAGDFWHGCSSGAVEYSQVPHVGSPRGFQVLHSLENISRSTSAGVWGRAFHIAHLLGEAAKTMPRAGGKEDLLWGLLQTTLLDQRNCRTGLRGLD